MTDQIECKKVLIACESSQIVTNEFRKLGFDAYSCDILPGELNKDWHIQKDIRDIDLSDYHMVGSHLPCTFMCNSGVSWLHKNEKRWDELQKSNELFHYFWQSDVKHLYIENPVPHKYALLPKYSQIIQPWQFGEDASKKTCLWLKNLPKLEPTNIIKKERYSNQIQSGQNKLPPSKDRTYLRAKTYPGIANAMAKQWSKVLLSEVVV